CNDTGQATPAGCTRTKIVLANDQMWLKSFKKRKRMICYKKRKRIDIGGLRNKKRGQISRISCMILLEMGYLSFF
ncbi:MAG: hypothetical protein ACN6O7_21345, partial [Sphingobacterium sp.]